MPQVATSTSSDPEEKTLPELLRQMTEQSNDLARMEIELAKAEIELKSKRIGIGIGAFGGAGLVALLALGALTATFILALATTLDSWLAALVVTVVYLAVAGVMALVGKKKVDAGIPPVPEMAIESSKQDVEQTKQSIKEGQAR